MVTAQGSETSFPLLIKDRLHGHIYVFIEKNYTF